MTLRVKKVTSLLKEVLSEVLLKDIRNPKINLVTVTDIDISPDLRNAKVFISVIGNQPEKEITLKALKSAATFIKSAASKKVSLRYFPKLYFELDSTVDKQLRVEMLLRQIRSDHPSQDSFSDDE
jgi:ribosome-binding factor A